VPFANKPLLAVMAIAVVLVDDWWASRHNFRKQLGREWSPGYA